MRFNKTTVFATVLALAVATAALAIAGCGGGNSKAQGLTKDANTKTTNMNETLGELGKQIGVLYAEGAGGAADKAKFETAEKKLEVLVDQISKEIVLIQSDYNQVKKIKGAEKYQEYADIQLQVLDLTKQSMDSATNFLKKVDKIKASPTFDKNAFLLAYTQLRQELSDQSTKSAPLIQQAEKLNSQNKLL